MAWWQSGYAEDCKSLYAGSIPTQASKIQRPSIGAFNFGNMDAIEPARFVLWCLYFLRYGCIIGL